MKKKAKKEIMVSFRITPELYNQIKTIANSKETSNASIVREAVIFFYQKSPIEYNKKQRGVKQCLI